MASAHGYKLVPEERQSISESEDAESAVTIRLIKDEGLEDYFRIEEKAALRWKTNVVWANIVLVIVFACSIILVLCVALHTAGKHHQHVTSIAKSSVRLDDTYQPAFDFDVVVSYSNEDSAIVNKTLSRVFSLSPVSTNHRLLIYVKDEQVEIEELQDHFPHAEILPSPKIGSGGETYLRHILTNWDHLARHTLFTEAAYYGFEDVLQRIDSSFVAEIGMLNLGPTNEICDCQHCADEEWHDHSGLLPKTYEMANNRTCGWLRLSNGPFIASAARIRGARQEVYKYLHDALVDPISWAHQKEYWGSIATGDSMEAPALEHSLQRMWNGIMQCGDLDAARCKLPAQDIAGRKRDESVEEDCQCFDRDPGEAFEGFEK